MPEQPWLSVWLSTQALQGPYWVVCLATLLWFVFIYTLIAGGAWWLAIRQIPDAVAAGARTQRLRPGQVNEELRLSVLSIVIFAAQTAGVAWLLRQGWLTVDWQRPAWHLLWELPVLYVWNDVHFFVMHRLLHWE